MNCKFTSDRPIYLQIMECIETEIAGGVRQPGQKMPSVRELAQSLSISPNTVQRAMYELERTGLLVSSGTGGKYIAEDTARIAQMRRELARRKTECFFADMYQLGYSQQEIVQQVAQYSAPEPQQTEED